MMETPFRPGTIAYNIYLILPQAIEEVSSGGQFKFSTRNLFYKVRELYLKKFPGQPFYKDYNTFTQDFLTAYEKRIGKINGLVREPRGSYITPTEWYDSENKLTESISVGVGNAILVVEKEGIYEVMKENKFHKRLDKVIVNIKGFTTEAGRKALAEIAEKYPDKPIIVLHDYDVNGLWIKESLTHPTKRRDIYVNAEIIDIGMNWEVIKELGLDVNAEPVKLSKQDQAKLDGLLQRGYITQEEYEFLKQYRVEINAMTPEQLLHWLEKRLEELGLWKTVPTEDELQREMKYTIEDERESIIHELVNEIKWDVEDRIGITEIERAIDDVKEKIKELAGETVKNLTGDIEIPTISLEEFIEKLRENMEYYWTRLAEKIAKQLVSEIKPEIESKVEEYKDTIVEEISERSEVWDLMRELEEKIKQINGDD